MAIAVGEIPYVHSNIEYFTNSANIDLKTGGFNEGAKGLSTRDIDAVIKELNGISMKLQKAAEDFLMGMGITQVNAEILKNPTTYSGIATRLIQDANVVDILTTKEDAASVEDIQALLNDNHAEDKINKVVLSKITRFTSGSIPMRRLTQIIIDAFAQGHGTISQTGTKLEGFFNINEGEIREWAGDHTYQEYKAQAHTIHDIIKKILKESQLVKEKKVTKDQAIKQFIDYIHDNFLAEAKALVNFYYKNQSPEKYLEDLEKELHKRLPDFLDAYNAAGAINEEVLVSINRADTRTTITITSTGKLNENKIMSKYATKANKLTKMADFHGESKQSQTDVLITNKQGMTVRAQSKTSLKDTYTINNDELNSICNYLQRTVNIVTLFENLDKLGEVGLNISNKKQIYYVLANALWFNTHVSVSGKREEGQLKFVRSNKHYPNILEHVIEALNIELSKRIPAFLGISLQKTANEITADVHGSNIFYIENGNLIPTYLELNEVIKDLDNYKKEVGMELSQKSTKSMNFGFGQKSMENLEGKWKFPKPVDFWKAKYDGDTYDSQPGKDQGAAAMSAITIEGRFDAILRFSAYTIGK